MNKENEQPNEENQWLKARPEKLPEPTYWPFFLALGLVLLFWGIITSWVIIIIGAIVFIISLTGWINVLRHEE
jgi:hypothetical protein